MKPIAVKYWKKYLREDVDIKNGYYMGNITGISAISFVIGWLQQWKVFAASIFLLNAVIFGFWYSNNAQKSRSENANIVEGDK